MRFEKIATFSTKLNLNGMAQYQTNKVAKIREIEINPKLKAIINKYKSGKTRYCFHVVKVITMPEPKSRSLVLQTR